MTPATADQRPPLSRRDLLFTLWIFVMFLYTYCDLLGLFDASILSQILTGVVGGIEMSQTFLLAAGVLMILPISMVLLTRILSHRAARIANIGVGAFKTVVMIATLATPSTIYYWMFGLIEIATTCAIVWLAWTWRSDH